MPAGVGRLIDGARMKLDLCVITYSDKKFVFDKEFYRTVSDFIIDQQLRKN